MEQVIKFCIVVWLFTTGLFLSLVSALSGYDRNLGANGRLSSSGHEEEVTHPASAGFMAYPVQPDKGALQQPNIRDYPTRRKEQD